MFGVPAIRCEARRPRRGYARNCSGFAGISFTSTTASRQGCGPEAFAVSALPASMDDRGA